MVGGKSRVSISLLPRVLGAQFWRVEKRKALVIANDVTSFPSIIDSGQRPASALDRSAFIRPFVYFSLHTDLNSYHPHPLAQCLQTQRHQHPPICSGPLFDIPRTPRIRHWICQPRPLRQSRCPLQIRPLSTLSSARLKSTSGTRTAPSN